MTYVSAKEQISLTDIFASQRLPRPAAINIARTLARWEQHYGIKWVVDRLKLLRSALLSGNTEGIRTHKDGSFFGAFRPVYRLAQAGRRGSIRADRILRVYGRWEAAKPTARELSRFRETISFPSYEYKGPTFVVRKSDMRVARVATKGATFKDLPKSENKIVPFIGKAEIDCLPSEHYEILIETCPGFVYKHHAFFQKYVYAIDEWAEPSYGLLGTTPDPDRVHYGCAGKISCLTKDRGLKHRFIANPSRLLQIGTSRLQDACARYLRALPESFVYNQDQAVDWVSARLKEGKRLFSLDLSSATDHFPLTPQVELLRRLFPDLDKDIDFWEDICRLNWELPDGSEVQYGKGQPMGTAPSFAAFTISHIHAVRGVGGNDSNFRVIGDDIVISDPDVALRYQELMKVLGVKISLAKSLLNAEKAEFAGRIIDKFGLWPVYKAAPAALSSDPLGLLRQYGMAGLSLVPKKLRPIVQFVGRLPLIGPPHCWDFSALEELDELDLDLVYGDKETPYPIQRSRPSSSVWVTPVSRFEAAQLLDEEAGFLGTPRVNHPRLAEHVNASIAEGFSSQFLENAKLELHFGVPIPRWDESVKQTKPVSYCKKLHKLRKKALVA